MPKRAGNFNGIEGLDYSVVFRGGFKAHSEAETEEDAFQVADLVRLSLRAQNPKSDYYRFSDLDKVKLMQERIVPYVGEYVKIRIIGTQVDGETGDRDPFSIDSDTFFLGSLEELGNAYLALLREFLADKKESGQQYGKTTLVSEIWVTYSRSGRTLPNDARYGSGVGGSSAA